MSSAPKSLNDLLIEQAEKTIANRTAQFDREAKRIAAKILTVVSDEKILPTREGHHDANLLEQLREARVAVRYGAIVAKEVRAIVGSRSDLEGYVATLFRAVADRAFGWSSDPADTKAIHAFASELERFLND